MTKPRHSFEGFRRYIQMRSVRVFILVEGKRVDSYFYGHICKPVCDDANLPYEVVRGDRLGQSGGKETLLGLYSHLHSVGSLTDNSNGLTKWCVFFLDKDVDDILRKQIPSPHIVYTPVYGVENVVFAEGELITALSAASSLDPGLIQQRIGDSQVWRRQRADEWNAFLVLCLFSRRYDVNGPCRFGRNTLPLNDGLHGPGNAVQIAARKAELEQQSGFPAAKFARKYRACERLVERIFAAGLQDVIFNGKWYLGLSMWEVEQAAPEQYNAHALSNGISAALLATLNFDEAWAEYYRGALRNLIEPNDAPPAPTDHENSTKLELTVGQWLALRWQSLVAGIRGLFSRLVHPEIGPAS